MAEPATDTQVEIIGRNIDRLMTVEMRISDYGRDVIAKLHEAAVAAQGGAPLCVTAARAMIAHVKPGVAVFITTGAGDPKHLPAGETDGPPGAAVLARAVAALGGVPILLTEKEFIDNLAATALAAGLGIRTPEIVTEVAWTTAVLPLSAGDDAPSQAAALLDKLSPSLVIAIEKLGPNPQGIAHTASGKPTTGPRARAEHLFDEAKARSIPTIGIGDNGNEIGYGLILDAVHRHKPSGQALATRVATDVLVTANTSNWGAYGIVAALAAILGRPEILHSPDDEARMIEACVAAHGVDGSTGRHILQVDGMPLDVQLGLVAMLNGIVRNGLIRGFKRPF